MKTKPAPSAKLTWQGDSVAQWLGGGRGGGGPAIAIAPPRRGSLEVVTRNMRPGYLLRNGVPYSSAAVLTEYWHLFKESDGTDWLVITTLVNDPTN